MSQDNANRERAKIIQQKDRRDDNSVIACEVAAAGDTGTDLGPLTNWKLDEQRGESTCIMDVKRIDSMAVSGKTRVFCDQNCLERVSALGV